jgi:hypothetical protein
MGDSSTSHHSGMRREEVSRSRLSFSHLQNDDDAGSGVEHPEELKEGSQRMDTNSEIKFFEFKFNALPEDDQQEIIDDVCGMIRLRKRGLKVRLHKFPKSKWIAVVLPRADGSFAEQSSLYRFSRAKA